MCIYWFCCIPYKLLFLVFWQIYSLFNVWRCFSRDSHEIKEAFAGLARFAWGLLICFFLFFYITKHDNPKQMVMLTIPYMIKDVLDERRRITCLTQFNLLTLCIAQASLLCSRSIANFSICPQSGVSKGSRWDPETSSGWHLAVLVIYILILEQPIQSLCLNKDKNVKVFWH